MLYSLTCYGKDFALTICCIGMQIFMSRQYNIRSGYILAKRFFRKNTRSIITKALVGLILIFASLPSHAEDFLEDGFIYPITPKGFGSLNVRKMLDYSFDENQRYTPPGKGQLPTCETAGIPNPPLFRTVKIEGSSIGDN